MTDRPILFSAPMVRALLDGRKSQTRRLAWKEIREFSAAEADGLIENGVTDDRPPRALEQRGWQCVSSPGDGIELWGRPNIWQKVRPGDRLWVRETHYLMGGRGPENDYVAYAEEMQPGNKWDDVGNPVRKAIPSIHMPRVLSRITLVVTETKLERLQEISEADAKAEGVSFGRGHNHDTAKCAFCDVWERLHKPGNRWMDNPELVALALTVHQANIDDMEQAA